MKDWDGYIREHVGSELWGFLLLDYYHKKPRDYKDTPSHFIDEVVSLLPKDGVDIVEFHRTLLNICVQLLGIDFSETMEKSIGFLRSVKTSPTSQQLEEILIDYDVYGKRESFKGLLESRGFDIGKTNDKSRDAVISKQNVSTPLVSSDYTKNPLPTPALDMFYQKLPEQLLEKPYKNTRLLLYYSQSNTLLKQKPFASKYVFFVLHFLKDLVPFVQSAVSLGLDMKKACFFYKDYPYPQRKAVGDWLEKQGAVVRPHSEISQYLVQVTKSSWSDRKILVAEDGGLFTTALHRLFPQLVPHVIGSVEQTTRGIRNAKSLDKLGFPILSVATSKLKNDFEPNYIAGAVVGNIKQMLPNFALNGKNIALMGCGTIGREIGIWLKNSKANVTIFDIKPENKLWIQQNGFTPADSAAQAAYGKIVIIGASGEESITSEVLAELKHGAYILSASSELYEIDLDELLQQAVRTEPFSADDGKYIGTNFYLPSGADDRVVHLLANGYPINFWGFESMPEEASDLILSLILLCMAELALGNYSTKEINSEAVNEIAKKYKVAEKFLEFHKQS